MTVSGLKMVRPKMLGKEVIFIASIVLCGQVSGMGDRWAWRSDVSSRRSQLDTDTSNGVIGKDLCVIQTILIIENIVKEIEDDNTLTHADKVQDESLRTARKVESESPEARFFLKDKLCAIGLADVSKTSAPL